MNIHDDQARPSSHFPAKKSIAHSALRLGVSIGLGLMTTIASADPSHPDRPQLIMFSIDDGLTGEMVAQTSKVDVPWTHFVSVIDGSNAATADAREALRKINCVVNGKKSTDSHCISDPELVLARYRAGHEIALHTYTHAHLKQLSTDEIAAELQKNWDYLKDAGIPADHIKGFRAPYLEDQPGSVADIAKDDEIMKQLQKFFNAHGMIYESSFSERVTNAPNGASPLQGLRICSDVKGGQNYVQCDYTQKAKFDWSPNGYPSDSGDYDPSKSWHILLDVKWSTSPTNTVRQMGAMDQAAEFCLYNAPCTADKAKQFWMDHFLAHYNNERTPFGIHIHLKSLVDNDQREGLIAFVKEVKEKYKDAYFVTGTKIVNYEMASPKPKKENWDSYFKISVPAQSMKKR